MNDAPEIDNESEGWYAAWVICPNCDNATVNVIPIEANAIEQSCGCWLPLFGLGLILEEFGVAPSE